MNTLYRFSLLFGSLLMCFASAVNAQDKNFKEYRFFINPGHGGHDTDDRNIPATGFWESEGNLEKGLYLKNLLEKEKATVYISRTTNTTNDDLDFAVIDEMANAANVDFFVSIHSNGGSGKVNRPLTLFRGYDNQPIYTGGKEFATILWQKLYKNGLNWTNQDIYVKGDWSFYPDWGKQGLGVLRSLAVPAVLTEGSFHDYLPESWRLKNMDYLHYEAQALFWSFKTHFGITKQSDGVIAGVVRDASKKASWTTAKNSPEAFQPMEGVKVTLQPGNRTYITDNQMNGFYYFDALKPGKYTLYVESPNGKDKDSLAVVVNPDQSTRSDFLLKTKKTTQAVVKKEEAFSWPIYNPTLDYNFKDEFPSLDMPTKDLEDCCNVVGTISSGWWTFKWGPNKRSIIDSASVLPLLNRMNTDFAYFRDSLGWPPDLRAKKGYRSTIYLFGSGLCTDNQDSSALGGWQSSVRYKGQDYPMVLASYYPIYSYNPACNYSDKVSQQSAMVHEGIHSVLADLPGCKKAAWFHEGGNTWLQQEADSRRNGDFSSMGFLNAASFIAPFMPIECYSGWLQDGSFGGPSAEGVNKFEGEKQICTWRNLLGGVQYSNVFPTFLGLTLGKGSIAWIWRNCPSRVLEGMSEKLGEVQTRRLILEYRAKQALVDMGPWTKAMLKLLNNTMGVSIKSEWEPYQEKVETWKATPYAKTTMEKGLLIPESKTLPGWSGANQIPLIVKGNEIRIDFKPMDENMSCQICYRTKDGKAIYSQPVTNGICSLKLQQPANGIVIVVVTNTNYLYKGEVTRKAKFDYRIELLKGVVGTADIHQKWYDWSLTISKNN